MIYFEQESAALERNDLGASALSDFIVAEYRSEDRGYFLELTSEANYRFIRFEPGRGEYLSGIYGTELEALDGIYFDRLHDHQSSWRGDWIEELVLAIAALRPRTEGTVYGKATARFARRQLAVYGDAELGYIIGQNFRGKYRFIHYARVGNEASRPFFTELEALEAAHEDCLRRDGRHRAMPWAKALSVEVGKLSSAASRPQSRIFDDLL